MKMRESAARLGRNSNPAVRAIIITRSIKANGRAVRKNVLVSSTPTTLQRRRCDRISVLSDCGYDRSPADIAVSQDCGAGTADPPAFAPLAHGNQGSQTHLLPRRPGRY